MNAVALCTYLKPFDCYFAMEEVSEICINRPEEVWVERSGRFERFARPDLTLVFLWQLAKLVAEFNHRAISAETPTLSATLPNGFRIQWVVEPACARGSFICSIRKPSVVNVALADYFQDSALQQHKEKGQQQALLHAFAQDDYVTFLKRAVLSKQNIMISGGTSTGKTTVLNLLLKNVPLTERLITIETDREVFSEHANVVHLLATEEGKSLSQTTMLDLLKVTLRLRPDRILVSELRSKEAFAYLRAINSGHPGSITTLHAESTAASFEQLAFMVMQSECGLTQAEVMAYAKSIVDIVVQVKRTDTGKRFISEIYFNGEIKTINPSFAAPPQSILSLTTERKAV
jgi:type IV secretion system protein VirB11